MLDIEIYQRAKRTIESHNSDTQQYETDLARIDLVFSCLWWADMDEEINAVLSLAEKDRYRIFFSLGTNRYYYDAKNGDGDKSRFIIPLNNSNLLKTFGGLYGYSGFEKTKVSYTLLEPPDSLQDHLWCGYLATLEKGAENKAAQYFYKAFTTKRRDANDSKKEFPAIRAEGLRWLIKLAFRYPNNKEIQNYLKQSLEFLEKNKSPAALLASCALPWALLIKGKFAEANTWYEKFVNENSDFEKDLIKIVEDKSDFYCTALEIKRAKFVYSLFKLLKKTATKTEKLEGFELIKQLKEPGQPPAYIYLSELYQDTTVTSKNIEEAAKCLLDLWSNNFSFALSNLVTLKTKHLSELTKDQWQNYFDQFTKEILKKTEQSRDDLEILAKEGSPLAMNRLGELFENEKNKEKALEYYKNAVALELADAMYHCGILLEESDPDQAANYYYQALSKNLDDKVSFERLSNLALKNVNAKKYLETITKQKNNLENKNKIENLQQQLSEAESKKINKEIAKLSLEIADLYSLGTGDASDLENVANFYVKFLEREKNDEIEVKLKKLADTDNVVIKNVYGEYLLKKLNSYLPSFFNSNNAESNKKIYDLFLAGAVIDYSPAILNLGYCHAKGIGVEKDEAQAFSCYAKLFFINDKELLNKTIEAVKKLTGKMFVKFWQQILKAQEQETTNFLETATLDQVNFVKTALNLADDKIIEDTVKLQFLTAAKNSYSKNVSKAIGYESERVIESKIQELEKKKIPSAPPLDPEQSPTIYPNVEPSSAEINYAKPVVDAQQDILLQKIKEFEEKVRMLEEKNNFLEQENKQLKAENQQLKEQALKIENKLEIIPDKPEKLMADQIPPEIKNYLAEQLKQQEEKTQQWMKSQLEIMKHQMEQMQKTIEDLQSSQNETTTLKMQN